jgi:hypothetical protein
MPTARPADDAAIREQAYYFWEADGRPDGRESEYWMRAVAAVTEKAPKPAPKKAAAKPKAAKPEPKLKAAATKTKAVPAKAEPAKKPKKK